MASPKKNTRPRTFKRDAAVEGWADTQLLDDGSECIRILLKLDGIEDAARSLIIEEALMMARSILDGRGATETH